MKLDPGTIAYWRDFSPGNNKFVYILGVSAAEEVLSFTISSQLRYLQSDRHKNDLIEIAPYQLVAEFDRRSFIQCFFEVTCTPVGTFKRLEGKGTIMYRACLPQFLRPMIPIVQASEHLSGYDQELVLSVISPAS